MAALLYLDSFAHYNNSTEMASKWNSIGVGGTLTTSARSGHGYNFGATGDISKTLETSSGLPILCAGVAYSCSSLGNAIISFFNDLGSSSPTLAVSHVGDGRLIVSFNGVNSSATTFTLKTNQFYYIELYGSVSGTSATYALWINESEVLSGTLSYSGSSPAITGWASVLFSAPGGGANATICDVYVTDGENLGDVTVDCLFGRLDGNYTDWTPLSAGAHYLMIKEHAPDEDSTYNHADTTGIKDSYLVDQMLGFSGTIKGVQGVWRLKKSDTGIGVVQPFYRSSGSDINGADLFYASAGSYIYFLDPQRKSLFTSSDWTATEINSLELGLERTL